MKIAILHPSYEGSVAPFSELDPKCDPAPYLPDCTCEHFDILKATAVKQVIQIAAQGFDAVINLCDGAWDQDTAGIEVVQALERVDLPFTGAGSAFYDPSREAMKMACHSAGVRFPAYVMVRRPEDVRLAVERLRFPMLVKHPHGYASAGIFPTSRVSDPTALQLEVERTVADYGSALVEEFIEGREFTVLVTEPRHPEEDAWALDPIEFLFPASESFKHFDLKWRDYDSMQTCAVIDAQLAERLREVAALTFTALNGSGFGRCDIRMDSAGVLYMLEINPNCGVFYPEGQYGSADFILARDPAGHRGFLKHLIACAIRRRDRARRTWDLQFIPGRGFGLFANRQIRPGEIVERYEERPHNLVSRRHVEQNWRGLRSQWFAQYAWPVTNGLHVLWSDNPDDWRPINHSCNPNCWLDGLDMTARRDIERGEELTVDYATFCGPTMAAFECRCEAAECRRIVSGSDYLLPEIQERYRDHLSDFVEASANPSRADFPFEVVPHKAGMALVARRSWPAGETITHLAWRNRQDRPSRWTVQIGDTEHAEPLPDDLRYVNHSCSPNVLFDVDAGTLRALREISPGDSLCYFYPATEWNMAEPFECHCGSAECLGLISGARQLPPEVIARYEVSGVVAGKVPVRAEAATS